MHPFPDEARQSPMKGCLATTNRIAEEQKQSSSDTAGIPVSLTGQSVIWDHARRKALPNLRRRPRNGSVTPLSSLADSTSAPPETTHPPICRKFPPKLLSLK